MGRILILLILMILLVVRSILSRTFLTPSGTLLATWILFIGFQAVLAPDFLYSYKTSIYILLFISCFMIGEYTYTFISPANNTTNGKLSKNKLLELKNDLEFKTRLGKSILILGVLSLFGSLLYVASISHYFGSLSAMLSAGWAVRGVLSGGDIQIPRIITAISMIGYSCVLLGIAYWILYGYRYFVAIPIVSVFIFGIAQAGRAGIIIVIVEVFFGSYWHDLFDNKRSPEKQLILRMFFALSVIVVIFFLGTMLREQQIVFNLSSLKYQIYIFNSYAFGAISGFTSYLDLTSGQEVLGWGRFSFASLYDLLGIHNNVMGIYTDYLPTSNTGDSFTNIYTIIRPLLDDFGILGFLIFSYITGILISIGYKRAMKGSLGAIAFSCASYTYLVHSPLDPITVHNSFLLSLVLPAIVISVLSRKNKRRNLNIQRGKI